ncbi:hypothetical protein HUU61_11750 [Rhodopseudomonas palustris]|uniref:Uncharacterized protein n=1 Tax=Thiospirillum jenense TaxID=1653858 RepID=A0A839HGZ7_9GAMM|nr:hypothetical protein [Thiospirillum jenense]MBB1091965.1 hypothetical protein [Rhodopseudomonas palustris]MBB1126317.1 hypothetical protein [Thiospirillum jenense]
MSNIHAKILRLLFAGWIILSFLIGGVVFYLEMEKIDDRILELATQEAATFTSDIVNRLRFADQTHPDLLEQLRLKAVRFLEKNFVMIELYNSVKQKILEQTDTNFEFVETELNKYAHTFPLENKLQYDKFYIHQHIYVQVLLPLKNTQGELSGYFEGVYQVDSTVLTQIRNDVIYSLALVFVVIFVTSIMLYPLIISLNSDLLKLLSSPG